MVVAVVLFVLLGGYPPFYDENDDKLDLLCLSGEYEWMEEDEISSDARDFVDQLLVVDPNKRVSAKLALKHRWFEGIQQVAHTESIRPMPRTLEKLRSFNARRKIRGAFKGVQAMRRMSDSIGARRGSQSLMDDP